VQFDIVTEQVEQGGEQAVAMPLMLTYPDGTAVRQAWLVSISM
jgi:hypothetical protein